MTFQRYSSHLSQWLSIRLLGELATPPSGQTPRLKKGTAKNLRGEIKKYENPAPCRGTTKKPRGNQKVRISHVPRRQSHCHGAHTHSNTVAVYTVKVTLPHCHCCTVTVAISHCLTVYTVAVTGTAAVYTLRGTLSLCTALPHCHCVHCHCRTDTVYTVTVIVTVYTVICHHVTM